MPSDFASSDNVYLGTEEIFNAAVIVGVKVGVGWISRVAVRLGVALAASVGMTVKVRVGTSEGTSVEMGSVALTVAVEEDCRRMPLVAVTVDETWRRTPIGEPVGAGVPMASEDGVRLSGATTKRSARLRATKGGFFTL